MSILSKSDLDFKKIYIVYGHASLKARDESTYANLWANIAEYAYGQNVPTLMAAEGIPEDSYEEKCAYVYDEADTFLFNSPGSTERLLNEQMCKDSICVFLTATAF